MTITIGLELIDTAVVGAAVDETGRVVARDRRTAATLADAAAACLTALRAADGAAGAAVAVAALNPDAAATADAMDALVPGAAPSAATGSGNAAAVAEAWIGAARGKRDLAYLAVADHVIGGILRDGVPAAGANRRAPAIAWLALNPVEREDYRKVGCLEAEVAAPGIVRRLVWRIKAGDETRVQEQVNNDLTAVTLQHVLAAARAGDGVAISVVRDTAKYIGMAAANIVAIADPDVLVLGGIMASDPDLLFEPVLAEVRRRLPPAMAQSLAIVPAALGADGPALGAVRLASAAHR